MLHFVRDCTFYYSGNQQLLQNIKGIYKESVELTFVYLHEGCGKTLAKINDTIPHTRIDMGYQGMQNVPVHRYLYESECCSVHPLAKKTSTFSCKDLRKTLSQYVTPSELLA